jgi:hypothetical protein
VSSSDLFRELPNTERNRQSDQNHVHQQLLNKSSQLERTSGVQCLQRQHNKIHHQKDGNPAKKTADKRMVLKERKFPACQVVDRSGQRSNKEMQYYPEQVCA